MNKTINALCRGLAEEAEAIQKNTDDIAFIGEEDLEVIALLKDIRYDQLEHIQKLALALTKALIETESEQTDDGGDEV